MPFPIYDVVPCMKTSSERTDAVMRKIQDLLHRNVSPKKYSNGQAFRLQQVNNILYLTYSKMAGPCKGNGSWGNDKDDDGRKTSFEVDG